MDTLFDQLATTTIGLGLVWLGYGLWLLTGILNAGFNTKTWSWKRMFLDIAKAVLFSVVVLALVVLANGIEWYAWVNKADITQLTEPIKVSAITLALLGGSAVYYSKALKNAMNFIMLKLDQIDLNKIKTDGEPDYRAAGNAVRNFIGVEELPHDDFAQLAAEAIDEEAEDHDGEH